jgi:hypothetical protein
MNGMAHGKFCEVTLVHTCATIAYQGYIETPLPN